MRKHTRATAVARKKTVTFRHSLKATVTARPPEFEYLNTLMLLDMTRLSRGRHRIDVGHLKGSCGKRLVKAVVNKGMITKFEIDPCKDSRPPVAALAKLVRLAQSRLKGGIGPKDLPVPFADFAAGRIEIGWGKFCIWVIIEDFGPQGGTVYFCCAYPFPLKCGALPFPPTV